MCGTSFFPAQSMVTDAVHCTSPDPSFLKQLGGSARPAIVEMLTRLCHKLDL
jgi:hypothetical protein